MKYLGHNGNYTAPCLDVEIRTSLKLSITEGLVIISQCPCTQNKHASPGLSLRQLFVLSNDDALGVEFCTHVPPMPSSNGPQHVHPGPGPERIGD